ncbi:MAG TPA: thioesterase family protein [Ktedonobacterales bacterium]|nr:thioesterase family protein [Ktedonobacterales bacterium]
MAEQGVLTARGTVYPWHCDHMGHMNVMWYVGKCDEGTWHLFKMLGLTPSSLRERHTGMVAVHQEINYRREMLAGAVYSIFSRVLEVRDKVIRFEHEMRDDETGEVAATMTITGVHIDTRERKSRPLPPDVLERARQIMASYGEFKGADDLDH